MYVGASEWWVLLSLVTVYVAVCTHCLSTIAALTQHRCHSVSNTVTASPLLSVILHCPFPVISCSFHHCSFSLHPCTSFIWSEVQKSNLRKVFNSRVFLVCLHCLHFYQLFQIIYSYEILVKFLHSQPCIAAILTEEPTLLTCN